MSRRSAVVARWGAVVVLGTLVAAGCARSPSSTHEGSAGSAGALREGGSLTVATGQGAISQLDPSLATLQWERSLYPLLWDGLTEVSEEGDLVPGLASTWENSEDAKEWTFTLRPEVEFTNGRAVTAKDIVWNIDRVIDPKSPSIAHQYLAAVTDVEEVDESTVRVTTGKPNVSLPLALSSVRIVAPESESTINKEPVGTGPFVVKDFVPNQSLTVARNEQYWGQAPLLDEIRFVQVNDSAAGLTAMRSHEIDVLWNVPTADAGSITAGGGITVLEPEVSTQVHYLTLDNLNPPFDDPRARRALAYAMDRDAIKDVAYSGFGTPAVRNSVIPEVSWAYDAELPEYSLDLEKAKTLFAEAGVTEGDTLTWWGIAGAYPEWVKEAQLLQANLEKIGITLKIENNEVGAWVAGFLNTDYPGRIVPNAGGDPNDPTYMFGRLLSGGCDCRWSNEEFDALAAEAAGTTDQSVRKGLYDQMQAIEDELAPTVVSMHTPVLSALQTDVGGVWTNPTGDLVLRDAGFTE